MLRFRTNTRQGQSSSSLSSSDGASLVVSAEAAVLSLATIFPGASPTFLRWAVAHHTAVLKPPLITLDHVVDAVSEKILDGLGSLYPRKGRGPDTEEGEIWRSNQDLQTLALLYPSHPLSYLRTILAFKPHAPAPLHLTAFTLASPATLVSPRSTFPAPPAILLPLPRPASYLVPKHERIRSPTYKKATSRLLQSLFPTVAPSSIAALMAEANHDYVRSREACERLEQSRGVVSRVWGSLSASLRGLVGGGSGSKGSGAGTKSKGAGGEGREKWERCQELAREVWEEGAEKRLDQARVDEEAARELNRAQYEKAGQLVECCCCFSDEAWEEMGACGEGHLVCKSCINTHVSVLIPTLSFPAILPPSTQTPQGGPSLPPSATHLATLIPCPSSCPSSLSHPVLVAHLTSTTLRAYSVAIDSALSRALLTSPSSSLVKPHKCPFCPYTCLRPQPFPLLSRSLVTRTCLTPWMALARMFLFLLASLVGDPLHGRWSATGARLQEITNELVLREGGAIFRCGRTGECGRESCLGCGGEVWGGVVCCFGGGPGAIEENEREGDDESEEVRVEKKKEECRLFVERAMSEALIRTCPRCELGFTKSEACNKMTCPRDGYKMCYVCRADLGEEGYSHFCQHFRYPPIGYCTECKKCDLNLSPNDDADVQAAGVRARTEWERLQTRPGGATAGEGWARNLRVGPRTGREIRIDQLRAQTEARVASDIRSLALRTAHLHHSEEGVLLDWVDPIRLFVEGVLWFVPGLVVFLFSLDLF